MIIVEVTKCGWLSEYITLYLLLPIGAIEGLLVGLGEAEPLHMRYQAEPRNERNRGFVGGFGRGGASAYALPGRAWERGTRQGLEGKSRVCWWVWARRSLCICVTRQSLGTRDLNYHTIVIMLSK